MDIEDIEVSSEEELTPVDQDVLKYELKDGDTINSVAERFGVSVTWLIASNRLSVDMLIPGNHIKILPEPVEYLQVDPITAGLYDPLQNHRDLPGTLSMTDDNRLHFEHDDKSEPSTSVDLLGHIESVVIPHPSAVVTAKREDDLLSETMPSLFVVTHFKDPHDDKTMQVVHFSGPKGKLEQFHRVIERKASFLQQKSNYVVPDPNKITFTVQSVPKRNTLMHGIGVSSAPLSSRGRRKTMDCLTDVELIGVSKILNISGFSQIRDSIPARFRSRKWRLVHQLSQHGTSYSRLYTNVGNIQPLVLLVKTGTGERLGAYCPNGLKRSSKYYGNGESFVFTFNPEYHEYHWRYSNANQYFVSSSNDELSFGGGGASAIWINHTFTKGLSDPCPTYMSPQLTKKNDFTVIDLEVWGISN